MFEKQLIKAFHSLKVMKIQQGYTVGEEKAARHFPCMHDILSPLIDVGLFLYAIKTCLSFSDLVLQLVTFLLGQPCSTQIDLQWQK